MGKSLLRNEFGAGSLGAGVERLKPLYPRGLWCRGEKELKAFKQRFLLNCLTAWSRTDSAGSARQYGFFCRQTGGSSNLKPLNPQKGTLEQR